MSNMVISLFEFKLNNRIEVLKRAIKSFTSEYSCDYHNKITCSPVDYKKIQSFDDYPTDYKLFLTTIGTINISTNGYHALEILAPQYEEQYPDIYGECEMWWGYSVGRFPQHVRVGILPCNYEAIGFDIRSSPFGLVSFNTAKYNDFLSFVEAEFATNEALAPHFKSAISFYC